MPLPRSPRHRRAALRLAAVALLVPAAALAGCGGDERDPAATGQTATTRATGDEARIRAVVEESYRTRDPKACTRIATQRFLEQVTFKRGAAARRECEDATAHASPARSVAISAVQVDGAKATARAVPAGGDADGQDATIALVRRGAAWRLDRMTGLQIDRERFDRALRRALVRPPDAMTGEQADCVLRRLSGVDDTALERALVAGRRTVILRATISCARVVFEDTIREELLRGSRRVTPAQADCVIEGLRERLTDAQLQQVLESSDPQSAPPRALTEALGALLNECTDDATTIT